MYPPFFSGFTLLCAWGGGGSTGLIRAVVYHIYVAETDCPGSDQLTAVPCMEYMITKKKKRKLPVVFVKEVVCVTCRARRQSHVVKTHTSPPASYLSDTGQFGGSIGDLPILLICGSCAGPGPFSTEHGQARKVCGAGFRPRGRFSPSRGESRPSPLLRRGRMHNGDREIESWKKGGDDGGSGGGGKHDRITCVKPPIIWARKVYA